MTATPASLLLTLGYGKRSIDEVIAVLQQHEVRYLVDIRSAPWSRYHPDFAHDRLREHLAGHGITYLFLGEELGGRPPEPECYDAAGRVDYEMCRQRPAFQRGIDRLHNAWTGGQRVALLCSESRPEDCHRSKLIGVVLEAIGLTVTHLDEDGSLLKQEEVMARLSGGQLGLFEDVPDVKAVRSRGRYRPGAG